MFYSTVAHLPPELGTAGVLSWNEYFLAPNWQFILEQNDKSLIIKGPLLNATFHLNDFMWFKISLTNYFNDRWNGKEKHTCSGLILPCNINFSSGGFYLLWALNLFWESDNNHKKANGNSLSHLYSPNSLHTHHSANIFTDFVKAIFGSLVKNSLLHMEF